MNTLTQQNGNGLNAKVGKVRDARFLNACVSDLEGALNHVWLLENKDVQNLCTKISVLIKEAKELAYSANESEKN